MPRKKMILIWVCKESEGGAKKKLKKTYLRTDIMLLISQKHTQYH